MNETATPPPADTAPASRAEATPCGSKAEPAPTAPEPAATATACCAAPTAPPAPGTGVAAGLTTLVGRIDRAVLVLLAALVALAVTAPDQFPVSLRFTVDQLLSIAPFLLISVLAAAWTKATGVDKQIARVFNNRPMTAIALASAFGALSPFCSCGVVPIIAGLLAAGVPLAPVMAFCIASPLMNPEMFILTTAVLGLPFTLVKTSAALTMGLAAGFGTHLIAARGGLENPLRDGIADVGCCGGGTAALVERPVVWDFWRHPENRGLFAGEARATGLFLLKWLTLAFFIESLMVAYIPAEAIGRWLGGDQWWAIPASVLVGVPAYLNGFAAIPTVDGLMDLGMAPGAAMAFMVAGGVTSIPAAMAVWALVRRGPFALYLFFGLVGSLLTGFVAQAILA